jgi:Tol biopolymer transport system component
VTFESADTSPAWSPDGSKLAFERLGPGDYDIWCTDNVPESTVSRASWGLIKATYRQGVDRLPN